jgi:hypothetical protein
VASRVVGRPNTPGTAGLVEERRPVGDQTIGHLEDDECERLEIAVEAGRRYCPNAGHNVGRGRHMRAPSQPLSDAVNA